MKNNFLICGTLGWCMEILWTGLNSIRNKERKLIGNTSIWMFPIYGMAAFLTPLCRLLRNKNTLMRGGVYTICIFATEFLTGSFLKKYNLCPWNYSKSRFHIKEVIRIDYAPLWFCTGLFYEKILTKKPLR